MDKAVAFSRYCFDIASIKQSASGAVKVDVGVDEEWFQVDN
jgi:hypothetical protein